MIADAQFRMESKMARRFVRQPDGKLAAFSEVVDDFTMWDADERQAIDFGISQWDLGPKLAAEKVKAGLEDHEPWKMDVPGSGLSRWNDCLESIALQHGRERLTQVLTAMGFADYDLTGLDLPSNEEERASEAEAASVAGETFR
jgi:hypothetical protein